MKIIHCADLHLDSAMKANLSSEKARERRNELLLTFGDMVDYAVKNNIRHIIIAGDLYDKKNISAAARKIIISVITGHPEIRFYYLRGNHDAEAVLNSLDSIPENLILFSDTWKTCTIPDSSIKITGAELTKDNNRHIFDSLVLDPAAFNIVTLHGQTSEQLTENPKGNIGIIPLRLLQNKGIDYLALGHIHTYSEGSLDRRGSWFYPGCLEGRGFDECGEHGFVLLDIDEQHHTSRCSFIPIARRTFHEIETDISGCADSQEAFVRIEQILKTLDLPEKDMAKILLTGETEISCDLNPDYLQKHLENRFYSVKIEDHTRLKIDYDLFAADTSLKGEFVRMVQRDPAYSDEQKAEIIQHGIRLLMGEIQYAD